MNRDAWITKSLYQANAPILENASLTEIQDGLPLPNLTWYDLDHLEQAEPGYPLFFNAAERRVALTNSLCHACIVSSTGKGKTTVMIENWVEILSRLPSDKRPTLILTDPKGELAPLMIPQIQSSYRCLILNLKDQAAGTVRINPLFEIYQSHHKALALEKRREMLDMARDEQAWLDISEEIEFHKDNLDKHANAFAFGALPIEKAAREQCWSAGGRSLIIGTIKVMLYESEDPQNSITATQFTPGLIADILTAQNDCEDIIELFQQYDHDPDVRRALSVLNINAKQTRDSYKSTATTGLSTWASRALRRLTSQNTLDFEAIARGDGDKPVALFIIADDREPAKNELLKFAIENLLSAQQTVADKQPSGELPRKALYLLDEFCNAPCMEKVCSAATIARSRGIFLAFVVQSYQQMIDRYSENIAHSLLDSCNLQVCLGSNDYVSKSKFAEEFGKRFHERRSFSTSANGSYSCNIVMEEVPVLRVSDIDALEFGRFYARFLGKGYRSHMTPYFMREDVNHSRMALPRLNRCVSDYLPEPSYDMEKSLERKRRKNGRPRPYSRFDDLFSSSGLFDTTSNSYLDEDDGNPDSDELPGKTSNNGSATDSSDTADSSANSLYERFMRRNRNGSP